jgi:glycosyltransferase involved in cell wall biosynthesis
MRVAIANWTARHAGGIETYVGRVSEALANHGHEIFFLYEHDAPASHATIPGMQRFPSASTQLSGQTAALGTLMSWKPDVVFVQRITDATFERSMLATIPAVFFAHDYQGLCISGFRTHRARQDRVCSEQFDARCLARFFPYGCGGRSPLTMWRDFRRQTATLERLHEYRSITCFSNYMRSLYLRHGFAEDRVHRVPPIDGTTALPDGQPRFAPHTCELLFSGRIDRVKGCHLLIDALPILAGVLGRDVVLSVAGSGPDEEACRARAARIVGGKPRVSVRFLGWQSPEECARLLQASDVLVMPSLWPEPLGLTGLEALHAGIPVAAFAVGAIPEWLEDGVHGALASADPPMPGSLAVAIARCIESSDIRAGVRASAQRRDTASLHINALTYILEHAVGAQS